MRQLWRKHADPDIRRLLLEIDHLREVLKHIEHLHASVDRVWKDEVGGQLVALEKLRPLLVAERIRTGLLSN